MAATLLNIELWLKDAPKNATHMAVVCDTHDWDDYPVYILEGKDAYKETEKYRKGENMTQLMEVYDLRKDLREQLKQNRAFNY
jgi:hypothetical protein